MDAGAVQNWKSSLAGQPWLRAHPPVGAGAAGGSEC